MMPTTMKHFSCVLLLVAVALTSSQALANEPMTLGVRLGGNYNYLTRPTDPAGDPTLLYGSAFAGTGLSAGVELNYPIGAMPLMASFGLLYGQHNGTGYAKNEARQQEQTLTLTAHTVHLPILLTFVKKAGPTKLYFGLGPEILFTVASSSEATYTGIEATPAPLETFNPLHIGVTGTTGLSFEAGGFEFPILLRTTWNPMMPGSTRARLLNYKNIDDLGQYQAAFDWQFTVLFGANFSL